MLSCKEHRLFLLSYEAPQDSMLSSSDPIVACLFLSHATFCKYMLLCNCNLLTLMVSRDT
jgi:hypothetical protein